MRNLEEQMVTALVEHLAGRPLRIPEPGRLFWRWFCDLTETRTYIGGIPQPISFAEIEAYARLHRWPMEARHVEIIRALDRAWRKSQGRQEPSKQIPKPSVAIGPAAFDAVFP